MDKNIDIKPLRHSSWIKTSVITSLYNCTQYLERFFKCLSEISNLHEIEFVFIHNNPTEEEINLLSKKLIALTEVNYQYLAVEREPLYKSWNRGARISKGLYLAVWNVDDLRFPDSLLIQAKALENEPGAYLVYGNKYVASSLNDPNPRLAINQNITGGWNKKFQDGSLIMWKKEAHEKLGYFDEQFLSLGDQDFWYRIAKRFKIIKVDEPLGVFLNERGVGISKSSNVPSIEKVIIGLRYGFYTQGVDIFKIRTAIKKYHLKKITFTDSQIEVPILKYSPPIVYFNSLYVIVLSIIKRLLKRNT